MGHLGPSGVFLWASFFLFLIYNYNIYEYINITNVCESGACTPRVLGAEGKGQQNPLPAPLPPPRSWGVRRMVPQSRRNGLVVCELPLFEVTPANRKTTPLSLPGGCLFAAAGRVSEGPAGCARLIGLKTWLVFGQILPTGGLECPVTWAPSLSPCCVQDQRKWTWESLPLG